MKQSESIKEIAAALAAFNAEATNPAENKTATVKSKKGEQASYSFQFADLAGITDQVRPVLAKHGLSIVQDVLVDEHRAGAVTTILHSSGEFLEFSPLWVPAGPETKDYGGATTYSRRYSLMAALGLASAEDQEAAPQSRATSSDAASEAQKRKIRVLASERGVEIEDAQIEALSKAKASQTIERLMARKAEGPAATNDGRPITASSTAADDDVQVPGRGPKSAQETQA